MFLRRLASAAMFVSCCLVLVADSDAPGCETYEELPGPWLTVLVCPSEVDDAPALLELSGEVTYSSDGFTFFEPLEDGFVQVGYDQSDCDDGGYFGSDTGHGTLSNLRANFELTWASNDTGSTDTDSDTDPDTDTQSDTGTTYDFDCEGDVRDASDTIDLICETALSEVGCTWTWVP